MVINTEIIIGSVMVAMSVTSLIILVWWSRRIIEQVAASDQQTARHLLKELNGRK